jgi:hypothetical protein
VPAPAGEFLYSWGQFRRVRLFPDVALLYYDKQQAIAVPPGAMTTDAGRIILQRIRAAGGRIESDTPDPDPPLRR